MSTNPDEGVLAPVEEAQLPAHRTEGRRSACAHRAGDPALHESGAESGQEEVTSCKGFSTPRISAGRRVARAAVVVPLEVAVENVGAAATPAASASAPAGVREGPRAARALPPRGARAGPRLQLPRECGRRQRREGNGRASWSWGAGREAASGTDVSFGSALNLASPVSCWLSRAAGSHLFARRVHKAKGVCVLQWRRFEDDSLK